ncbi:uncharacterized domain 1-containing protein [Limimonas halophila]|uniref:Uncharacterized domain 1-containing protein n=1 Tax=Limimonas halophila TaxID=1082479 RepID=A0A1G7VDH0_9PROT|nr:PaaI family thioesterase [Limimonas halophila]SDG56990.1 uncharacterized domain 1-containing protein [Limimonas halophila]
MAFTPATPDYAERIRESFARGKMMDLIGAEIAAIEPGYVAIALPHADALTQQHGFFHAGAVATIADTAGGYAAYTLFPAGTSVLTAEFKINFLAPARGVRLLARGRVIKPGRTLTTCDIEVAALGEDGGEKLCAKSLQTMAQVQGRDDIARPG